MKDWTKENWVIIAPATARVEHEDTYAKLVRHGVRPREFILGDALRAFLTASGIPTTSVNVFKEGILIADVDRWFDHVNKHKEQYEFDF